MKFYTSQIDLLLAHIAKGKIRSILLYGPDKGYISTICSLISCKQGLIRNSMQYSRLQDLALAINTRNFFSKRELIKVDGVTNNFDTKLNAILSDDFFHFPVFIADELPPSSKIRKLFETEDHLASIGCYNDNEQDISKIVLSKINKTGKTVELEAITYLKTHLKGDHLLVQQEIDKLIYFVHDKTQITLEDTKLVISQELLASGDVMCIYFARKELENFSSEFLKLTQQPNINEILILRALIRYYLNLYQVVSKKALGEHIQNATDKLSPPIFFKYVNDFKQVASKITVGEIVETLSLLQEAELKFKKQDSDSILNLLTMRHFA